MAQQYEEMPKPGDLIEFFRGLYQHWAVYIGDGIVVNLAPPSEGPGAGSGIVGSALSHKGVVKKEKLEAVAGGDRWRISNKLDDEYKPRPSDIIVKEALAEVGKVLPYNLLHHNCEHFANDMRYGNAESRQVKMA